MKRGKLPFDTRHFDKLKKQGKNLGTEETFREIYRSNHWSGNKSVSGQGSDDEQTREISIQIPRLINELGIKSFLDVPCGDFHWFSKLNVNLDSYTGGDIISEIVEKNNALYKTDSRSFIKLDLIEDSLPKADILLCRDCLVHLSYHDIEKVLENIRRSGIPYLLTTTFPNCDQNLDITTGDWRIINLEKAPFNLPEPIKIINEKCTEANGSYADKSLGLWKLQQL
jgi:hypothetical protein